MAENQIQRGEVYFVHLDPVFGREVGGYKTRPVIVVSIDDTFFQCHQVRAIDQGRMTSRPIGRISKVDLLRISNALIFSLGLEKV